MSARPTATDLLAHGAFLKGLASGLLGDPHRAEDVVQEAYRIALERPPEGPNLGGWLHRVTRNLALKERRTTARRRRREEGRRDGRPLPPDPAETAARLEIQRRLADAVLDLEEPGRTAVLLRYYDGLSPTAIATRLGVSVRTVESRLRRARARLRARLDRTTGRAAWPLALLPLARGARDAMAATTTAAPALAGATATGATIMSTKAAFLAVPALLAAGFFAGRETTTPGAGPALAPSTEAARVADLEAENARLKDALAGRNAPAVRLEGAPARPPLEAPAGRAVRGPTPGRPEVAAGEAPSTFSLDGVRTAQEAVARFLAYAEGALARGPQGHLDLLRTLGRLTTGDAEDQLEALLGNSEEEAMAALYPLLRFAVHHEQELAALTETVFRTLDEDPEAIGEAEGGIVEMFTEGLGPMLPAVADEEQLERLRAHVHRILERPDAELPRGASRRRLLGSLRAWTPRLDPEAAREQLASGTLDPNEAHVLLSRMSPEELKGLDLLRLLEPALRQGDAQALTLLARSRPDAAQVEAVDAILLGGPPEGMDPRMWGWYARSWLLSTDRRAWTAARPLLEAGLEAGGRTAQAFATAVVAQAEAPDPAWVAWILPRTDLPEELRKAIEDRAKR